MYKIKYEGYAPGLSAPVYEDQGAYYDQGVYFDEPSYDLPVFPQEVYAEPVTYTPDEYYYDPLLDYDNNPLNDEYYSNPAEYLEGNYYEYDPLSFYDYVVEQPLDTLGG